VATIRVASRRD